MFQVSQGRLVWVLINFFKYNFEGKKIKNKLSILLFVKDINQSNYNFSCKTPFFLNQHLLPTSIFVTIPFDLS